MSEEFLSVSELNNFIKDVIKSGFAKSLWVCGEIQDLKEKNRHFYFTLSEKDPDSSEVKAKISARLWANARIKIDAALRAVDPAFVLKDDIEVKLLCKVEFYAPFGQVYVSIEGIDPVYTLGKIAQDRLKLIAKLKTEGVLEQNKHQELSLVPLNIGLITSYDSAAYHDFIDELKLSGLAFKVYIVNAIMQGKNTEKSCVAALKVLDGMSLDVLVITRGGGSIADLACFDSEMIARAIARCKLPVVSGIGHEINTTVTDLAAYAFAKTPTATAQMLIQRVQDFLMRLDDLERRTHEGAKTLIDHAGSSLKASALSVSHESLRLFRQSQQDLALLHQAISRRPLAVFKNKRQEQDEVKSALKKTIHLHLQKGHDKIKQYTKLIEMADPVNILKKGFSITRNQEGRAVKSVKNLQLGGLLTTELVDGKTVSEIKKVINNV